MNTRTLTTTLLAVATATALSACTTEAEPTAPGATNADEATPVAVVSDPAAVLAVQDQTSQGPTVRVDRVALTGGGFVVVAGDGGKNILGSGTVPAGTTPTSIQVALAEEITKKTDLVAQLFNDENKSGLFDAGDRPVTNGKDDEDDDTEVFAGEQAAFTFSGKPVVNG